jgi:O-antigen ligase
MTQLIATIVVVTCIIALFILDRDAGERTSKALWIPVIWMLIVGSRGISEWMNPAPNSALAEQFSEGSPLDASVFGILIAGGLLTLNLRSRQVAGFLRANLPFLLFLSYCAISIIWSDYPFVAFKHWFKTFGDVVMVLVVLTDPNPMAAIKRFFSRTAFVLLPLSVLFILFFPDVGSFYDPSDHITYYNGVTTQKNELGMICLVLGLAALWSLLGAYMERRMPGRARHLAVDSVVFATAVWLIVKADSMTSLSCFVLAGAVMVLSEQRWVRQRAGYVHAVVGGAVGLAVFAAVIDTTGALLRLLGRNPTLTGRTEIWKAVLSFHTNPLLGTGYDSFWLGDRLTGVWQQIGYTGIGQAHNGYLEIYINLGWLGVMFFLGMIAGGYRNAARALRENPNVGILRIALLSASVMYSLTEAGFRKQNLIWLAFLLAISDVPAISQFKKRDRSSELQLIQTAAGNQVRILR